MRFLFVYIFSYLSPTVLQLHHKMQLGFITLPTSQSLVALETRAEFKGNIKDLQRT